MNRVAFYTLGCKLNYSETSTLSRMFEEKGYVKVKFEEGADIYVINTCSVTDHADRKCRKVVKEAKKFSAHPYIIITGCYAQLKPEEIITIPGVDLVLGAAEKFRLFEYTDSFVKKEKPVIHSSPVEEANIFHKAYSLYDRTRTFLKIQDGCDYSCSFCTIPLARGKSRSDSIENVVQSAREIAREGIREIVLTGVNTGDFGIRDGLREDRFIDLIQRLESVQGIERFRISSIEPNLLNDEIIRFVAGSGKFTPHFHVPLQSGSDKILKLMRRRYLTDLYREKIEKIKERIPRACIGVDVITGFPGETDRDFLDTHEFLNSLDISYLHVFPFSERARTRAIEMEGRLPHRVRYERAEILRNLSKKKRRKFYEDNIGQLSRVLFENEIEDGNLSGFTENYIRVEARYDPVLVNEIKTVRLLEINKNGNVAAGEPERIPAGA